MRELEGISSVIARLENQVLSILILKYDLVSQSITILIYLKIYNENNYLTVHFHVHTFYLSMAFCNSASGPK